MLRLLLALGGDDLSEKSFTIGTACKQCRQGVDMCNDLCYARLVGIFCRLIYLQHFPLRYDVHTYNHPNPV